MAHQALAGRSFGMSLTRPHNSERNSGVSVWPWAAVSTGGPIEVAGRDCRCAVQLLWRGDETRRVLVLIRREGHLPARPMAHAELTPREREVLQWVAAGKTNAQIAEILSASPRTIGKHLENIYAKLGVETRTAAVNRSMDARR